jgi:hypothetical protein
MQQQNQKRTQSKNDPKPKNRKLEREHKEQKMRFVPSHASQANVSSPPKPISLGRTKSEPNDARCRGI